MRICKLFALKILKTIEERHENSHTKKFPDPVGQESVHFVCSSVFIVMLTVFGTSVKIDAIIHYRPKGTKFLRQPKKIARKVH